jgi:lipopolysaccharide transport system ATP-binding protein
MEKDIVVKVENVSKKFCRSLKRSLIYAGGDVLKDIVGIKRNKNLRKGEFWALDNISFELRRGECLGLIGHNGAGKSTLLKILNGLIRPDEGEVRMDGNVNALIELGAGFSPYLTGRENIYNNGSVLCFSKAEIDAKFNDIVRFSEIAEFIDTPVQNYSSGMKVRLGFAIAAQMEPDILLIDEVLAVGDMGFVLKCFNHMDKLLPNTAIVLVSHNIPQVARMATKIVILDKGKRVFYGDDISDAINHFYSKFDVPTADFTIGDEVKLLSVSISNKNISLKKQGEYDLIDAYEPAEIRIRISTQIDILQPFLYLAFYDKEQRNFAEVNNFSDYNIAPIYAGSEREYIMSTKGLGFAQGLYSITIAFGDNFKEKKQGLFRYQSAIYFQVHNKYHGWAPIQILPEWESPSS